MRSLRLLLLAAVLLSRPLCAAEKNIIFVIADDLSPTLGCYGDKVIQTPAIDALARDGLLFRHAFATTASCSASRSVVLSGLHNHASGQYGHQHGYHHFSAYPSVAALALPRVLAGAGYRTGHVGKYHVGPEAVFHFEQYFKANQRNPVELANAVADFIREPRDPRPFFLYYAMADPHRSGTEDESVPERPNLFGNKPNRAAFPGITEKFYAAADMHVPPFLPATPACRAELAQYAQSVSRLDQGVARLVQILQEAGLYEKTLIVVTSDHGIAMPGAKTTVYEPGLRVPFIVRNPYVAKRGLISDALISHVDITPSLLDFAGGYDAARRAPAALGKDEPRQKRAVDGEMDNPGPRFTRYHGRSWLPILEDEQPAGWDAVHASHTFHEIQMYYPMRVVRDRAYKLIWNIAHPLPFPFASDLWAAPTWQAQYRLGPDALYGVRTVGRYIQRPRFELFDLKTDPDERHNLATDPNHRATLETYIAKLKAFEKDTDDPWVMKWDYE